MTIGTDRDMTKPLTLFTEAKLETLQTADLSGQVFKQDSSSCGIEQVRIFNLIGPLKDRLTPHEWAELDDVMEAFRRGLVPVIVPITLVKQYAAGYGIDSVRNQVYLNPDPNEMKLRNSI